jgi:TetR/AcrR family transcriptional regulator, transcriptional repressor for nem operon
MRKTEITKRHIIEKSAVVFNKKGFFGTHMSDLTRATGLTKGSIYGNFKDKDEVALQAFRYSSSRLTNSLAGRFTPEMTSAQQLNSIFDFYLGEHKRMFAEGGCPIMNTAVDSDDGNPRLRREVKKFVRNWIAHFTSIIAEGIREGVLRETDPESLAIRLIVNIEGGIMLAQLLQDSTVLEKIIADLKAEIHGLTL